MMNQGKKQNFSNNAEFAGMNEIRPESLGAQTEQCARNHRSNVRYKKMLTALGSAVALMTAVALIVPAFSMSRSELICDFQEHAHSDACYATQLTCGQEESDEHAHTEACYETALTCGVSEHVHAEDCYAHVQADDEAVEEAANTSASEIIDNSDDAASVVLSSNDEADMPAIDFEQKLERDDASDVKVTVKAPEGAFPEGTTMEAKLIAADDVKSKVEEAIERENGAKSEIKGITAVDIIFKDKDGNEIEPAKKIEVKITSDDVRDFDNPALVHVLDKDKDSSQGKTNDAEVVSKVEIVNEDEASKIVGTEDTMRFESKAF